MNDTIEKSIVKKLISGNLCGKNINKSVTDTIQILIKYDAYAYYKVCQNDYFICMKYISVSVTKIMDINT